MLKDAGTNENAVSQRFWSKVNKTQWCWVWTSHSRGDYGQFWLNGRFVPAHRWSYEQVNGPVPDGLQLDHLCRNRACVNPEHLQAVTVRVNVLLGTAPTAENARKTHCKRGHPLSGDNLFTGKQGRKCRECHRMHSRAYWRKHYRKPEAKLAEAAGRKYHVFDAVRDAGFAAAEAGVLRESNPYSGDDGQRARYRRAWFKGFDAVRLGWA